MSKLATLVVAVGALALAFVTLSPNSAEPVGAGVPLSSMPGPVTAGSAIGPTTGPMLLLTAIPTAITPIGADATGAAGIMHARRGN